MFNSDVHLALLDDLLSYLQHTLANQKEKK